MKRKLLSTLMLTLCLCSYGQKKVKFEYDSSGNLIKRYVPQRTEDYSLNDIYGIKLIYSISGNTMTVKFYEKRSNFVVDCHIDVKISPITSVWFPTISVTSEKGEFDVDISTISTLKGSHALNLVAIPDRTKAPIITTLKFSIK